MENVVTPDTGALAEGAEAGAPEPSAPESPPSPAPAEPEEEAGTERGRSTISFAYASLADAERIAQELHQFGGSATPEGIANVLGQKPGSGAFRQKLSAARIFGFVTTRPGRVSLSRLGRAVIDPERQARARADAFLNVPLHKAIFEKYQGDLLPPTDALDEEIRELGVSPKQAATARQIMFRSAEHAGYFARGPNRLVMPDGGPGAPAAEQAAQRREGANAWQGLAGNLPTALEVPLLVMFETGESWSPQQTHDYVDALRKMRRALEPT